MSGDVQAFRQVNRTLSCLAITDRLIDQVVHRLPLGVDGVDDVCGGGG